MPEFESAHDRLAARLEGRIARPRDGARAAGTGRTGTKSNDFLRRISVYVIGLYFVAKMLYVFDEGGAQPADVAIVLLAIVTISPRYLLDFLKREPALTMLVVWITLVNIVWFSVLLEFTFLMAVTYYIFNLIIAICVVTAYRRDKEAFEKIIPIFIAASVLLQAAVVFGSSGTRSYGTFANPNQLAYWSVTAISVLLVVRRNKVVWWDFIVIMLAIYCAMRSVSRAGLIALFLLAAIWAWFVLKTPARRMVAILMAIVLASGYALAFQDSPFLERFATVEAFEARQAAKSQKSLTEERNLDRVIDYYAYTVLGAGEGDYARFEEGKGFAIEIHSSLVTLLFSYGIIGFMAFLAMSLGLFLRLPLSLAVYQIPMLSYGLTHNGLRFSFYWIVMGLLFAIAWESGKEGRAAKAVARKPGRREEPVRIQAVEPRGIEFLRRMADE